MKRILLFTLLISFIGYSQNPIQPNIPNFEDGLPQDLVEKMKPMNLEFGDGEMMNFNPIKKGNIMESKSFQRVVMVENNNSNTLRLDGFSSLGYEYGMMFSGSINSKIDVEFDENGNQTLFINYSWDSESQSFVPNYKYEYSYDENGNQTLYIYYNWDSESQSFVPDRKTESTYDDNGNHTLSITYNWDSESQSFVPSWKTESTFDDNGNHTLYITYNWDSESQSFVLSNKYEFTYDENGNLTLSMLYNWDSESQSFVLSSKYESTYDDNGNQTLYIGYGWDSESQSFFPGYKDEFTYDENGNQTLRIDYRWSSESQSFVPSGKIEYTYDENGNQTLRIGNNWDSESQSLVPNYKSESTYDDDGNQTLFKFYYWDSVSEVFYERVKQMKSYDEFGYVLDYEIHNWIQELSQMKPVNKTVYSTLSETDTNLVREGIIYEYDTNFNTWNELEGEEFKSYFYYTKTSSLSTNSIELNSFSIYPNPTKGYLKVNSSESLINPFFELYDIKGSKIFSKPFNFSEPIDVNGLKPSIYLYKIIDGNEVKHSGKLIKK